MRESTSSDRGILGWQFGDAGQWVGLGRNVSMTDVTLSLPAWGNLDRQVTGGASPGGSISKCTGSASRQTLAAPA